jgi:hypothetical protein
MKKQLLLLLTLFLVSNSAMAQRVGNTNKAHQNQHDIDDNQAQLKKDVDELLEELIIFKAKLTQLEASLTQLETGFTNKDSLKLAASTTGLVNTMQRKNAIKLNIVPPLLSATSEISYERFVKPNLSIVAGIGANLRADQSDFQLASDADLEFLNRDIQNFYFLAEVRRYIYFCECSAPHGFYAGGFTRYNSLDYASNPRFRDSGTSLDINLNVDVRSINFGILLGYQVKHNNWLIDFEFGGLGYSPIWISFNSDTKLSSNQLARLSNALNRNFGIGGNYKDIELNSSSAEFNFWYWTIRYAVSVGYSF